MTAASMRWIALGFVPGGHPGPELDRQFWVYLVGILIALATAFAVQWAWSRRRGK